MSRNSGKVVGSYESIIRGVSQQPPHLRFQGQHWQQFNVNSDPVRGLCTRGGTFLDNVTIQNGFETFPDSVVMELCKYRSFKFKANGGEYLLMYRTEQSAMPDTSPSMLKPYVCYNLLTKQPVLIKDDYDYGSANIYNNRMYFYGFNTFTQMGNMLLGSTKLTPGYNAVQKWNTVDNWNEAAIWIKAGAYKRTYKVTLTKWTDSTHTATVDYTWTLTTPASTYPTAINIPAGSTADQIAKITSEYNSAANIYLGTAAQAIQPERIASDLATAMTGTGAGQVPSTDIRVVGSHILIDSPLVYRVSIEDSGDGSFATATSQTVQNINQLTSLHFFGHVVKVAPKKSDSSDAYYLKATGKNGEADGSGYGEVVWKECAGYEFQITGGAFCYGVLGPYGPGGSEALVFSHTASTLNTNLGTSYPTMAFSQAGDNLTNPVPYFVTSGKAITYLGMFQDRLVVGCGSMLNFSRSGDYLNFFRQSVLTLADNDPIEMTSNDTDQDIIQSGVLFDRSLYLIGIDRQYSINGRVALTPTSQNIAVVGNFNNRSNVPVIATDNNIFLYKAKYPGDGEPWRGALYQMQYGQVADVTEAYSVSQQLDTYLNQQVIDMTYISKPNMIFLRAGDGSTIYNYRFVDAQGGGERLQSAWDSFGLALGYIGQSGCIGMSRVGTTVIFITMTKPTDSGKWHMMCSELDMTTRDDPQFLGNADLDNHFQYIPDTDNSIYTQNPTWSTAIGVKILILTGPNKGAVINFADRALVQTGGPLAGYAYAIGTPYNAFVQLTLPYAKNYDGSTSTHGYYVLNKMQFTVDRTPGFQVIDNYGGTTWTALDFNGYPIPIDIPYGSGWFSYTGRISFQCNFDVREGGVTIGNKPGIPFRISAINYDAQNFPR